MAARKTKSSSSPKTTSPKTKTTPVTKTQSSVKKTTASKKTADQHTVPVTDKVETKVPSSLKLPRLRIQKKYLLVAGIVIGIIGLAVYYRSLFVVAMVNGEPITRLNYIQETEGVYIPDARVTAGKQALNQIVTKTLIFQEARKKNITVSEKEIDDEIAKVRKNLESSGQSLESALALQGDTLDAYKERIRIQKLLEKLAGNSEVSDKEIDDYMTQNKETLPTDMDENELRNQVKESLKQQKFNEKVQTLIQDLQKKAKVTYLIQQ